MTILNKTLHNEVVQTTYNDEILAILLRSLNVHEIGVVTKRCDVFLNEQEECIDQFKNHQFSSSYLLLESLIFEIFHTHMETI